MAEGNILSVMQSLSEAKPPQKSINNIIETSYKIAVTYLSINYRKVHKIVVSEGLSIEDIAVDSIAPLFIKNDDGYFYILRDAFEQWQPAPQTDEDAFFLLNKVIARRVEQQIVLLLKESDPMFSKLLDSVYYLIKKNCYKKINYFGHKYIVEQKVDRISGQTIDEVVFDHLPAELFFNNKEFLSDIFTYLKNETGFFPAIPINILIHHLKLINSNDYFITNETKSIKEMFDINELVNNSFKLTINKLNESYVSKGKLSTEEAEIFTITLKDICEDLKDGGLTASLFEYFQFRMKNLSKNEYMANYNHILQYLVKLMKNTISDKLHA
jgi:hypothetical protein